jgi:hypothetical protein
MIFKDKHCCFSNPKIFMTEPRMFIPVADGLFIRHGRALFVAFNGKKG